MHMAPRAAWVAWAEWICKPLRRTGTWLLATGQSRSQEVLEEAPRKRGFLFALEKGRAAALRAAGSQIGDDSCMCRVGTLRLSRA